MAVWLKEVSDVCTYLGGDGSPQVQLSRMQQSRQTAGHNVYEHMVLCLNSAVLKCCKAGECKVGQDIG
jgi:hypothetical protein